MEPTTFTSDSIGSDDRRAIEEYAHEDLTLDDASYEAVLARSKITAIESRPDNNKRPITPPRAQKQTEEPPIPQIQADKPPDTRKRAAESLPYDILVVSGHDNHGRYITLPLSQVSQDLHAAMYSVWEEMLDEVTTRAGERREGKAYTLRLDNWQQQVKSAENACMYERVIGAGDSEWYEGQKQYACKSCMNNNRLCIKGYEDELYLLPLVDEMRGGSEEGQLRMYQLPADAEKYEGNAFRRW